MPQSRPLAGRRRRLGPDRHDLAWTNLVRRQKNAGNMWREVNHAIGAGTHDYDTERQYFYQYFAYAVRAAEQLTVLDARLTATMHV